MSNRDDDFFNDDPFRDFDDDDNFDDFRNFNDDDDDLFAGDDLFDEGGGDDLFANDGDDLFANDDDFFGDGGGDDLFADDDDIFGDDDLFANDSDPFGDDENPFGDDFDGQEDPGGGNRGFIIAAVVLVAILLIGFGIVAALVTGVVELPGGPAEQTRVAFETAAAEIEEQNATVFAQQTGTAEANGANEAATQTQAAVPTNTATPSLTPTPEIDQEGTSTALAFTQAFELTLAAPTGTIDPNLSIDDQRATAISRLRTQVADDVLNTQVPVTLTSLAESIEESLDEIQEEIIEDDDGFEFNEVTEEATEEATEDPNAQARNPLGGKFMFAQDRVDPANATEGATAQYVGTAVAQAQDLSGTSTSVFSTAAAIIDVTLTAAVADLFLTFPAQEITPEVDLVGTQVAQTLTAQAPEETEAVPTLPIDTVQQTATALANLFNNTPTAVVPTVDDTMMATATSQVVIGQTPAPTTGGTGGQLPQTGLVDDLVAGGPFSIFAMIFGLGAVIFISRRLRKRK